MAFVFRMTVRELRASWRRLLFFFVCVAIGVGAIVALRSVIQNVRAGMVQEARAMMAADVRIGSSRPWSAEVLEIVERRLSAAPVLERTESVETATMVRAASGSAVARMVELLAVQPNFPLYGEIELRDGVPFSHELLRDGGVIVRPELLAQLGVAPGEAILIGGQPFTIRGVLLKEPGRRAGGLSLGSRVFIDHAELPRTGLLTFGSRASYQIMLRVEDHGVDALTKQLREDLRDRFAGAWSYRMAEDDISDELQRAENYLSLVGFVIVVLGGIGVWSVTRVFVRQKIRSVAILKCLGATTRQVLGTYVLQVVLLGLAGSVLGVSLAAAGLRAVPASVTEALGGAAYGLTWSAVLQGCAVGLLVSLLFSLVPLLEVRRVKPILLLRGGGAGGASGVGPRQPFMTRLRAVDRLQVATGALVGLALLGVASWQASSVLVALIVCGGFAGLALLLHGAGALLVRVASPLARARSFPLRHAVLGLRRPGNQTRVILLAVGLGTFFVLGVRALQANLLEEFSVTMQKGGPDMFLIDIQQDQVDDVRAFVEARAAEGSGPPRMIPVLRARVTGVQGAEVNLENYQAVRGRGSLAREYTITYRDHLEPNEKVIQGAFWTGQSALPDDAAELEVSIERSIHERFSIGVGDLMRFDILGRTVQARVTSVRDVKWEDSRNGGFMFVFRPGPLSQAPHMYIAILRAPEASAPRAAFQHDLVSRFPNVSAIDVREVLTSVQGVLDNVTLGITIVGGIAVFGGVLILIGAVAMTKFQRVYEAAILRTLGASSRTLTAMLAGEYTVLGLLAGSIGAAGALVLSWGVSRYVFTIDWHPAPGLLIGGALATALLVAVIGVLASGDVLRNKPLATLRAE
ncbi:MAG TPA: FtsX-like permease family protein [Vicinamibacterales bacterium]|nr:FtsX-like permease family protein [Vicinamibacterales bacterium]